MYHHAVSRGVLDMLYTVMERNIKPSISSDRARFSWGFIFFLFCVTVLVCSFGGVKMFWSCRGKELYQHSLPSYIYM